MLREPSLDEMLHRARSEYLEMPGLSLTADQARRLWGLESAVCDTILTMLVASGFLRRIQGERFVLNNTEQASMSRGSDRDQAL